MAKKSVCVDLDDVLAKYDGWKGLDHIGEPFTGAREFMRDLRSFSKVVVHTTRCCPDLDREVDLSVEQLRDKIAAWLDKWQIPYDEVWIGAGKPAASAYVDDRAVVCAPSRAARNPELGYRSAIQRCRELVSSYEQIAKSRDE